MQFSTANLSDANLDAQVVNLQWRNFGGRDFFFGQCFPLRVEQDHRPIDEMVSTPGEGRVLVVDSGGSLRIGVFGDRLAAIAVRNGWAGVIVNGAIRDTVRLGELDLGVKAIGVTALRSREPRPSVKGEPIEFGDVRFEAGDWVYCDQDAVLVSKVKLDLKAG
ncbi:MAG: ribonuclease E activity regulator RraA [Pseudomonadota bacterium]